MIMLYIINKKSFSFCVISLLEHNQNMRKWIWYKAVYLINLVMSFHNLKIFQDFIIVWSLKCFVRHFLYLHINVLHIFNYIFLKEDYKNIIDVIYSKILSRAQEEARNNSFSKYTYPHTPFSKLSSQTITLFIFGSIHFL